VPRDHIGRETVLKDHKGYRSEHRDRSANGKLPRDRKVIDTVSRDPAAPVPSPGILLLKLMCQGNAAAQVT